MNSAFKIAEFDACIIVARSRHRSIIRDEKQIELKIEFFFSPFFLIYPPKIFDHLISGSPQRKNV